MDNSKPEIDRVIASKHDSESKVEDLYQPTGVCDQSEIPNMRMSYILDNKRDILIYAY
jgi:hypothetical protein